MEMDWQLYDPTWLVRLAEEQKPEESWLPEALRKCIIYSKESVAYYHFVSPMNANKSGADWQFKTNIYLNSKTEGWIVLDILEGNRVGGVEFLEKITESYELSFKNNESPVEQYFGVWDFDDAYWVYEYTNIPDWKITGRKYYDRISRIWFDEVIFVGYRPCKSHHHRESRWIER